MSRLYDRERLSCALVEIKNMPGINRRSRIGIVDITEIEDDENSRTNIRWCPNCEEAGVHIQLGKRIYLPEQPDMPVVIPADADEWLQCRACGTIIPKYAARGEGELQIDGDFELVESPFDFGQGIIENVMTSRRIDKSKMQLKQLKNQRKKDLAAIDPDIRKELIEGGTITSYEVIK